MQIVQLKKGVGYKKKFKKGDIIFWKGHVAICINTNDLIHAYGPKKKVIIMNIKKTLEEGWVSAEGPNVEIFEKKFSKFIGHKYAVTVANGTAALEIAVQSLNLPKNSE